MNSCFSSCSGFINLCQFVCSVMNFKQTCRRLVLLIKLKRVTSTLFAGWIVFNRGDSLFPNRTRATGKTHCTRIINVHYSQYLIQAAKVGLLSLLFSVHLSHQALISKHHTCPLATLSFLVLFPVASRQILVVILTVLVPWLLLLTSFFFFPHFPCHQFC